MKRIIFLLITVVLTLVTSSVKSTIQQQSTIQATQEPSKPSVSANVQITKSTVKEPEKAVIVAPAPVPEPKTCASEVRKYNWNHNVANAVMLAESGGVADQLNDNPATKDYSVGCFQVNLYGNNKYSRPSEAELKNPEVNVKWSYEHYQAIGQTFGTTGGWGAYNSGAYLKYLQ